MEPKPARKKTNPRAAAKAFYKDGKSLKESLAVGGYSETQVRKGRGLLAERKSLAIEFSKQHDRAVRKMAALGQAYAPEMRADLIRGRLIDIALDDKSPSASVRSCELLGKDKAVNMFQPDTSVNLFSLEIPSGWESRYLTTPVIDAEEIPSAVASKSLDDLPKTDGMITLSSFSAPKLTSGKVVVPDTVPTTPEPVEVPITIDSATEGGTDETL